jgi:uncharacterized repeat protein (TIGR01451 family)
MKTKTLFTTLAISLGLTLALLWTLGSLSFVRDIPAVRAQGPGARYVRSDGNDSGDCTNPATPCRTVQYGADQAAAGDEILVATGVYTDPAGTVVALDKTVTLQGGWNSDFSTQDPASYPTTLDACRMGSVISITGQSGTPISPTIDGFIITHGDASSQAIKGGGLHSIYADPIITNNVFTNNIANSIHYYTGDGGGVYLAQSHGVAVIQNNVFISNTAAITGGWGQGGAIYREYSSPLIVGNVISGNFANGSFATSGGGNGGGIVVYYGMTATTVISGNQLFNNVASTSDHGTGGGMTLGNGPMLIQNNTVRGNAACVSGSGSGGGIFLSGNTGPVTITGNLVEDNIAGMGIYGGRGGGVFLEYMLEPGPVVVQDNTIISNTASTADWGYGGGIYLRYGYGQTVISDNRILSNTGSTAEHSVGGGICLISSSAIVQDNTLRDNTASTVNWAIGGGLYLWLSDAVTVTGNLIEGNFASTVPFNPGIVASGGGIGVDDSDALIQDNTIRDNVSALYSLGQGGGLYARDSDGATIEENIIEDNVASFDKSGSGYGYGGGIFLYTSDATVHRNTILENRASSVDGCGGGILAWQSGATLDANTILSNTAAISVAESGFGCGGGVSLNASDGVSMTNNFVAHNQCGSDDSVGKREGAGIWARGAASSAVMDVVLLHNTVADNAGEGVSIGRYATATLTNNIIAGNTVAITNTAPASVTFSADHTLFWNNGSVPISGSNPIFDNPAFVGGGDYHLTPGSAAIDAGVEAGVTHDIDSDPRPAGGGPDVGADEVMPSLGLGKTAPGTVPAGHPITYTLTLTNNNPFTVTNVVVSDTVPVGAAYISGGSYAGGIVSWTIASIAPLGGVAQVGFVVTATATITNSQYSVVTSTEGLNTGYGPPVVTVVGALLDHYVYLPLALRQFSQGEQALRSEETTGANKWQAPSRWEEPGGDGLMPLPPQEPKLH